MPFSSLPPSPAPHPYAIPMRIAELAEYAASGPLEPMPNRSQLLVVWGGKGALHLYEHPHKVARGFALLGRSASQAVAIGPGTSLQGLYIEFVHYPPSAADNRNSDPEFEMVQRCSADCMRLAAELYAAWQEQPDEGEPYRVQLLFSRLLSELRRELSSTRVASANWLSRAVQFIEANYTEDLTREQLAERANVSPEHFSRAFRKHTGRTFIDYLTMLRIRNAQSRILVDNTALNALARQVGFKEGLYLSRKFKDVVGMSPTAFRRKPKRIAALNLNHTGILMALGQTPELGVYTSWLEKNKARTSGHSGISLNPNGHTPTSLYDAVAEARPDMIIHYNTAKENRGLLPLAPVIELPFRTMNWREQLLMIANMVDKRREAEQWLARYDEQVDRINRALDERLGQRGTAIVWELAGDKAFACSGSYGRGAHILYGDLGFRPPEPALFSHGYVETSVEELYSYPADHIFITGTPSCPKSRPFLRRLSQAPQWSRLEAVRSNHLYWLYGADLFCGYDPLSTQAQLNILARQLLPDHKFA
ncbi:AraC family transcriptional regulator [Cohnella sp. LGH]|uniref:AraC family transcriptional regulator n=1 Tax=Cohnella sp. LGH TaxID=1619153 RepID=UPI001ADCC855|nr:AraC family transcriptional regulator [Cohnella sp. LGH]QTH43270.1 AraC family transcriptional regulator [Cohnella sp. LGH]